MHPELLSSLATEHCRDLRAAMSARRPVARRPVADRARPRAPRVSLPRFRVSWTRTRLAAVAGSRRGSSLVIVISATRTARPGTDRGSLVRAL
jgi:hypothetical protein